MLGLAIRLACVLTVAATPTWCGKAYLPEDYAGFPPSGQFIYPPESPVPLLDFRCYTAHSIYTADDGYEVEVLIDAELTRDIGDSCESSASYLALGA